MNIEILPTQDKPTQEYVLPLGCNTSSGDKTFSEHYKTLQSSFERLHDDTPSSVNSLIKTIDNLIGAATESCKAIHINIAITLAIHYNKTNLATTIYRTKVEALQNKNLLRDIMSCAVKYGNYEYIRTIITHPLLKNKNFKMSEIKEFFGVFDTAEELDDLFKVIHSKNTPLENKSLENFFLSCIKNEKHAVAIHIREHYLPTDSQQPFINLLQNPDQNKKLIKKIIDGTSCPKSKKIVRKKLLGIDPSEIPTEINPTLILYHILAVPIQKDSLKNKELGYFAEKERMALIQMNGKMKNAMSYFGVTVKTILDYLDSLLLLQPIIKNQITLARLCVRLLSLNEVNKPYGDNEEYRKNTDLLKTKVIQIAADLTNDKIDDTLLRYLLKNIEIVTVTLTSLDLQRRFDTALKKLPTLLAEELQRHIIKKSKYNILFRHPSLPQGEICNIDTLQGKNMLLSFAINGKNIQIEHTSTPEEFLFLINILIISTRSNNNVIAVKIIDLLAAYASQNTAGITGILSCQQLDTLVSACLVQENMQLKEIFPKLQPWFNNTEFHEHIISTWNPEQASTFLLNILKSCKVKPESLALLKTKIIEHNNFNNIAIFLTLFPNQLTVEEQLKLTQNLNILELVTMLQKTVDPIQMLRNLEKTLLVSTIKKIYSNTFLSLICNTQLGSDKKEKCIKYILKYIEIDAAIYNEIKQIAPPKWFEHVGYDIFKDVILNTGFQKMLINTDYEPLITLFNEIPVAWQENILMHLTVNDVCLTTILEDTSIGAKQKLENIRQNFLSSATTTTLEMVQTLNKEIENFWKIFKEETLFPFLRNPAPVLEHRNPSLTFSVDAQSATTLSSESTCGKRKKPENTDPKNAREKPDTQNQPAADLAPEHPHKKARHS